MMRIIDRYILTEWLKIFLAAMLVTLGILILHDAYSDLPDLISYGASASQILWFYCLKLPAYIPVVLPISLLLSIIFALGSLHRNSEIIAMRAAGLTIFQISRSLWFAGILLAGALFVLDAHVVPKSVEAGRRDFESLKFAKEKQDKKTSKVGIIKHLSFNNRQQSRIWFMNDFVQSTNQANLIEVHILDELSREKSLVKAKEAYFDDTKNCWYFLNGIEVFFDVETSSPLRTTRFDKKCFEDFNEDPNIMKLSIKKPKDLSMLELRQLTSSLGEKKEMLPYAVQLQNTLTSPFICIIVVAIAIPFSVAGVRTNPMVGVSKTVGLFFTYYVLINIFTAIGSKGYISPIMAAWIPNILMLFFALSLYRKNT